MIGAVVTAVTTWTPSAGCRTSVARTSVVDVTTIAPTAAGPGQGRLGSGRRWAVFLTGLTSLILGIGLSITAGLGVGSWQVLETGLVATTGLGFGVVAFVESVAALLLAWFWLRQTPWIATGVLAFGGIGVGALLDALSTPASLGGQVGMLAVGTMLLSVGVAFYLASDLGASAQDSLFVGIYQRYRVRPGVVRFGLDAGLVVLGILLGGQFGIGTLVLTVAVPLAIEPALRVGHRLAATPLPASMQPDPVVVEVTPTPGSQAGGHGADVERYPTVLPTRPRTPAMRGRLPLFLSLLMVMGLVAPATALDLSTDLLEADADGTAVDLLDLSTDVIQSDNVTYHGTIPIDSPGVGGEVVVREDLGKTFFYATGAKGLSIYDVTDPASPVHVSTFPFPHAQNEDVRTSADGTIVMIAADGSILVPIAPASVGITMIDVTDPTAPFIAASNNDIVMGRGTARGISEHTAECAVDDCSVVYGRTGRIYEVDFEEGTVTETGQTWNTFTDPSTGEQRTTSQIHALDRDETGLVIADSTPRLVLDPLAIFDPASTPEDPSVISVGERPAEDNRLQHNNRRPRSLDWVARTADDVVETRTAPERTRSISIKKEREVMRAGELLIGNSESNLNATCGNAGGLTTWSMVNFDRNEPMEPLEVFKPLSGTYLDGSPAVNALGCSGHWFTERDGVVAASWYEHGIHLFDVDPEIGTIDEVGYFQPVATEAGAAYWVDDSFVYSVDYARGIDIISFDREAPAPSQSELDSAWIANLGVVGTFAEAERYFCRLNGS